MFSRVCFQCHFGLFLLPTCHCQHGEGGIVNTLNCCFVTDAQRALIAGDVFRLPVTVVDTLIHVTHTVDTVPGTWQEIKLNLPIFLIF